MTGTLHHQVIGIVSKDGPGAAGPLPAARSGGNARISEIEGVRGLLSLIVVGGHVFIAGGRAGFDQPLFWYAGCMEVFFCISGFLITRILLANLGKPGFMRNYFIRRILRIWPMYYLGMLFTVAVYFATGGMTALGESHPWHPDLYEFLAPILYLQNLEMYLGHARLHYLYLFDHSWSVAVEEQFYLLWPFVMLLLLRRSPPALRLALGAGAILLSIFLRGKLLYLGTYSYWLLGTRLDGFVLGAFLAYMERAALGGQAAGLRVGRLLRWLWLWPCLGLLPFLSQGYLGVHWSLPHVLERTLFEPYFNFALLGFSVIGYCLFHGSAAGGNALMVGFFNNRVMAHLGTISYSTYLLHVPIIFGLAPLLMGAWELRSPLWGFAIGYGLTLTLAHFSFNFVEAQAMRLKKRFSYGAGAPA